MTPKKIGVVTFWTSKYNYGQILQGYALQRFLNEKGYNAYIIRFDSLLSRLKEIISIGVQGKLITNYKQGKLRHFDEFKKINIQYSRKRYNTLYSLQNSPPEADYYIVGSDQVWTYMRNAERRDGYLLRFGNKQVKKIAYAVSFGRDSLNEDEKNVFKESLADFSFVGVREESGMNICKSIGIESYWVVDPVALLSASEWRRIASSIVDIPHSKTSIFLYSLTDGIQTPSIYNIIDNFSNKYKVYYANSSEQFDRRTNVAPSIEEWIAYINQCDIVVTDSFHCTLFCILLQKNFVTIRRHNGERMSNRLTSLLNRLNLIERYVDASPEIVESLFHISINWEYVNKELEIWKLNSMELLLKTLDYENPPLHPQP